MPKDHPFWDTTDRPIAIAHRGGALAFGEDKHKEENTLKAFSAVWKLGYKYLEMDVINTADDKVIVIHVAKNRFEALQRHKEKPNSQRLQNMTHQAIKELLGRDIPTLEEILTAFPKAKLIIDAKTDEVVEPLARIVLAAKALDRVCFGSFYPHRLVKFKQLLGKQACLELIVSRSPAHFFRQKKFLKNEKWRQQAGISVVAWPQAILNRPVIKYLHKLDLKVLVWTVNNPKNMQKMARCGVDGIISDNAQALKQILTIQK
jgi:glycerophosphoryl diester phosphodiesterase